MRSEPLKKAQKKYDATRPRPIAFRLAAEDHALLDALQRFGESKDQAAKRILQKALHHWLT